MASTGVPALDQASGGGGVWGRCRSWWGNAPRDAPLWSCSTLAAATRLGQVVALVDALDRFDPVRAAERPGCTRRRCSGCVGLRSMVEMAATRRHRPRGEAGRAGLRFDSACGGLWRGRARSGRCATAPCAGAAGNHLVAIGAHQRRDATPCALLVGETPMGRSAQGVSVSSRRGRAGRAQARKAVDWPALRQTFNVRSVGGSGSGRPVSMRRGLQVFECGRDSVPTV